MTSSEIPAGLPNCEQALFAFGPVAAHPNAFRIPEHAIRHPDSSSPASDSAEHRPIKGELFGAARLGSHARKLARRHKIVPPKRASWRERRDIGPLLSRLDATEAALTKSRDTLVQSSAAGADVGPAGAWLLDNFFVVAEQVTEIRATLPAGYYQTLPKLAGDGPRAGYPRIYEIVMG